MKRLLAILIILSIMLSLVACVTTKAPEDTPTVSSSQNDNTNKDDENGDSTASSTTASSKNDNEGANDSCSTSSSSNKDNENTDNSTTASSSTGTGNTEKPKPSISVDRTQYSATTLGSGEKKYILYIYEELKHPIVSPYYNGYKSAVTMTFDDGYDTGTGRIVSDQYEKYGFRGTMMLGACFVNNDTIVKEWNDIFARGYLDVGCHAYNHVHPSDLAPSGFEHEIKDAIMYLREKFPTQRVLTFATPFAQLTSEYENYLKDLVIGNRLESGGALVNLRNNINFNTYRVKAFSVNKNQRLGPIHDAIQTGIDYGNWTVELFHCVLPNAQNSTDISQDVFEYHCEYLYRNFRDQVWFATFEEVLIYAEQLKHVKVEYTDCNRETMTFKVTPDGQLDSTIYNIPVSLEVYLPSFVDSAYALVNGEYQDLVVTNDEKAGLVYTTVKNISFLEESEVVIYIGGNKTMKNNCVHKYVVDYVVEPTHEEFGYTVNKCTKCEHTYNTAYTGLKHDFEGDVVAVIEPTDRESGLSKYYCTQCDKYEVREVKKSVAN